MADDVPTQTAQESEAAAKAVGVRSETELRTAGQRQINRLWEYTQSFIAMSVTACALAIGMILVHRGGTGSDAALDRVFNVFFLVIGFYFGRTNHQKSGGVGTLSGDTR